MGLSEMCNDFAKFLILEKVFSHLFFLMIRWVGNRAKSPLKPKGASLSAFVGIVKLRTIEKKIFEALKRGRTYCPLRRLEQIRVQCLKAKNLNSLVTNYIFNIRFARQKIVEEKRTINEKLRTK